MMSIKTIEIESFNPYEKEFPNRKLITKEGLKLIKYLRTLGYKVVVLPKNNKHIEYLFKKGDSSFLSDPTVQILINIPITILTTLITNWIQTKIDKRDSKANNILIIDQSTNLTINAIGKKVSKGEAYDIANNKKEIKESYSKAFQIKSDIPGLPTPIFLNHTTKIIGWCRLSLTDKVLGIEKGIIIDKNIYRKIKQGKFKGCSITGIAKKSICNICDSNYVECNHIAGETYNGLKCTNSIIEADIIEVSIVKKPINKETFIKLL